MRQALTRAPAVTAILTPPRRRLAALLIIPLLLAATEVVAEEPPEAAAATPAEESRPRYGLLPALAALVPGQVVHGSGHMVAGDFETAYRLLALESSGLGAMGAGALALGLSHGSRYLSGVGAALVVTGFGLFSASGVADIYGAATGGRWAGTPRRRLPPMELGASYAYVHDPLQAGSSYAVLEGEGRLGSVRLSPSVWLGMDADTQRYRLGLAYVLFGPRAAPWPLSVDGSRLELRGAVSYDRFGEERFKVLGVDVTVQGRLDLGRLGRSLRGSFAELELGWGMQLHAFPAGGVSLGDEYRDQLLAGFTIGFYLGGRGELGLYYDHRRDGLVGGIGIGKGWDGAMGHVGLRGWAYLLGDWGLVMEAAVGSAYMGRLGIIYRPGGAT